MELPFESPENFKHHRQKLEAASHADLATLASGHTVPDATVVHIYALIAYGNDASDEDLQLEYLERISKLAPLWEPREIALVPEAFSRLLNMISAVKLKGKSYVLKAWIFYVLSMRLGPNLTIAHLHLVHQLRPTMQRYTHVLFDKLILDYDSRYGAAPPQGLCEYFSAATRLLIEQKNWRGACIHAKCAVSTCNRRDPLPQLYGLATLLHLIVFRNKSTAIPGYITSIMSIEPVSEKIGMLVSFFDAASKDASLRPKLDKFTSCAEVACASIDIDLSAPLQDAYKITWLEALHKTMPKCGLAQVEQSCAQKFDFGLLERGYNAQVTIEDGMTIFQMAQTHQKLQWETLHLILDLTKRLTGVRALANPVAGHVLEMEEEDILL